MIARRLVLTVFCSLMGVLALTSAAPAFAEAPVLTAQFAVSDLLVEPGAVAVDQASGDVYVLDFNNTTVAKFDAKGNPVAFTSEGSYIDGNRLSGTPTEGGFANWSGVGHAQVAVDNSSGSFKGDVYVTDPEHGAVDVFASSGEYLGRLTGFGMPLGVAVDGAGRVYVADFSGFIERYTPTAQATPISNGDYTFSELSGVSEPCALAVDGTGDVFVGSVGFGQLNEFAASQFPASGSAPAEPRLITSIATAVATDPASGHVYVDEGAQINVYETAGATPKVLETIGSGALSGRSYGITIRDTGGTPTVYASDDGPETEPLSLTVAPTVYVYGAPPMVPPVVVSESASNVTADSGDIQGQVNPEFSDTTYHFEYGPTASYGTSVPLMDRDIGSTGGPLGVQSASPVHLVGLQPGTAYHYRIVAKNAHGTTPGADATFTTQPASAASMSLDERAYELVSPVEKKGQMILGIGALLGPTEGGIAEAEAGGDAMTYVSNGAFAGPVSGAEGSQYVATRGAGDWTNANITPRVHSQEYPWFSVGGPYEAFSSDLTSGLLFTPLEPREPASDPRAPAGYVNFVIRNGVKGGGPGVFEAAFLGPISEPASSFYPELLGANHALTHIIFGTSEALTPEAINDGMPNLYEWTPGELGSRLQLVNVLPGQTQGTPGAYLGVRLAAGGGGDTNTISDDGARVYFTDNPNPAGANPEPDLYLREFGKPTVQVDAAAGGPESGFGEFDTASSTGSRAFFTSSRKLTANSRAEKNGRADLYMFEAATHELTDITPGGDVQGVLGASEDGSYIYFVANGVLAPGASPGRCWSAAPGVEWRTCNLYVWHNGTTAFIARLSGADNEPHNPTYIKNQFQAGDWNQELASRTARVSSDGRHVVFMSDGDLTGYDNRNIETGVREQEVYVYAAPSEGASSGVLRCVSCDPSGARPEGVSSIPAGTPFNSVVGAIYQSRVVSSDENGKTRVFFDSASALVPQDTNGMLDVYEWEEAGRGGCHQASGCLGLVSSGTSSEESLFLDASANGDDVFFLTQAQLAVKDTDNLLDVYDARAPHVPGETVGSPAAVPVPPPCSNGDSCKGPVSPQPTIFGASGSATFSGASAPVAQARKPPAKVKAKKAHRKKKKRSKGRARTRGKSVRGAKKSVSGRIGR